LKSLPGIIDDAIRSKRPNHLAFPALHTPVTWRRKICKLNSKCAYAARCAVDEDILAGSNLSAMRRPCKDGECRNGRGSRILER